MDDKALLLTHMEDLAQRAQKTGIAHSKFLTPGEGAQVAQAYAARKDVALVLDGGIAGAERQVAIFLQPDWGTWQQSDVIAALALHYRRQDTLRHQDVLGAVLGLGLSRQVLGDIVVDEGRACLVCLAPMAEFIATELKKAGRAGVEVSRIDVADLPHSPAPTTEKTTTVASLRLDAVTAAAFNWPRSAAGQAIQAGRVQLSHRECTSAAQPVANGDIVSVRGKGRIKLLSVDGETRKGRQRITLGYY